MTDLKPPSSGRRGAVDWLAEASFDDQCIGTDPRFPLISELRQLLLDSHYGRA